MYKYRRYVAHKAASNENDGIYFNANFRFGYVRVKNYGEIKLVDLPFDGSIEQFRMT